MLVLSWNTLIRQYEEEYNPNSSILLKFPEELTRLKKIVDLLYENIANVENFIVCLQECSGELLKLLSAKLNCFITSKSVNTNASEFLVILTSFPVKIENYTHHSAHGFLVVSGKCEATDYRIINSHLIPQRYAKKNIFEPYSEIPNDKITFILGDLNERYKYVYKHLSNRFMIPKFHKTYKNKQIDYIMINTNVSYIATVLEEGLSDHRAVKLII